MKKLFLKYYESYCKIADVNMTSNGKKMKVRITGTSDKYKVNTKCC